MHDLESRINKITETDNYMEQLQQITGNIFTIEKPYFENLLKKVDTLNKMIIPTLLQYFEGKNEIIDRYEKISNEFNVVESSIQITIKKPGKKSKKGEKIREEINYDYVGKKLLESDWFNIIKELEKNSNDLLESFDTSDFSKVKESYDTDKMLLLSKTFYGIPIISPQKLSALKNINRITNEIIDLYTHPLYDVRKKIIANWSKLGNIFKGTESTDDIINMIEQFIICKYRCEITGSNKYYMKLFQNLFSGENSIEHLEGSKVLRIVDSIDNDQLDKNSNVFAFSGAIKTALHAITNNEKTLEEALNEIKETMEKTEETEEQKKERTKINEMDDPLAE